MPSSSGSKPRLNSPAAASLFALKGEAARLRTEALSQGRTLTHMAALEQIAQRNGFRSWNAMDAHLKKGGDSLDAIASTYLWQQLDEPLPALPMRIIRPSDRPRHESVSELMRWARQLEMIADKVPEDDRREMLDLIGGRQPYAMELSRSRWPDGCFHLCDRGYEEFKGVALTQEQADTLGLPAWNEAYGQHGGIQLTVVGDDLRRTRDSTLLKRIARLLASLAIEVDKTAAGSTAASAPG